MIYGSWQKKNVRKFDKKWDTKYTKIKMIKLKLKFRNSKWVTKNILIREVKNFNNMKNQSG